MEITAKSGKKIVVDEIKVVSDEYSHESYIIVSASIPEMGIKTKDAYVTRKANGQDGYFVYCGQFQNNQVFASINESDYNELEKTIREKQELAELNKANYAKLEREIIEKLNNGELETYEEIIGADHWEGKPGTKYTRIKGYENHSCTVIDRILSQTEKSKQEKIRNEKAREERIQKANESMKKAIANGYCPKCGTYCHGDCGISDAEYERESRRSFLSSDDMTPVDTL